MIPHSLQIKNFLSYGAETQIVDFRPYHLMHLSGKNGHGKSALLDAITWAIWGYARKITNAVKPDQGLLRLGATQMMVLFDFQVGDQLYRVRREFMQTSSKQFAYLEFGIIHGDGSVSSLTDKTIRATQEVIERTIRLDYESFVNTAFLRQGCANEFSKKSPKDRKEILGTILGLEQFDLLKSRAFERMKEAVEQRRTLQAVQEALLEQLKEGQNISVNIEQFHKSVETIKQLEHSFIDQKKEWSVAYEKYNEQKKEHDFLQFKYDQIDQLYQEQLHHMRKLWHQWRKIHAKQITLPDYKSLETKKNSLLQLLQQYQGAIRHRISLQESAIKLKQELHDIKQTLLINFGREMQQLEVAYEHFKFEKLAIEKNQKNAEDEEMHFKTRQKKLQSKMQLLVDNMYTIDYEKEVACFEKRKKAYQEYTAKANWLQAEYESILHKKNIVDGANASCPMCEQNLSASRRKFLGNRFIRQEHFMAHQLKRLRHIVTRLKLLLVEQHQSIETIKDVQSKKELLNKELLEIQQKKDFIAQQINKIIKERRQVDEKIINQEILVNKKREEIGKAVEQDLLFKKQQESLSKIENELKQIVYDQKTHENIQLQYDQIEKQIAAFIELNHEILNQPHRAQEVVQSIALLKKQKKQLLDMHRLQKEKDALAKGKEHLEHWEKKLQKELTIVQEKKEKIREEHGRIKTRQEQNNRIEKERQKNQEIINKLNNEIEDYQLIAMAAGKDGIQALLIEEAVPEIEQEANYLLSKLTNNQSHILIESLRDLKSGGSKETLDINISDATGIRPYEMFSGGEAFRIDFALRIAISKLLARRAGTSLQTLIIDEGFGSQDEEGLSLIMDAIYKIQADFEKVIVVSHLSAMRDQFPVHFVVEKGPSGSKISVIEQG